MTGRLFVGVWGRYDRHLHVLEIAPEEQIKAEIVPNQTTRGGVGRSLIYGRHVCLDVFVFHHVSREQLDVGPGLEASYEIRVSGRAPRDAV